MCFVREWKTGLIDICNAERLSQNITCGLYWKTPISQRKKEIHISSAAVDAMALYSASAVERDTVGYFLALHEMQLDTKKVQNPVVEHLVRGHLAQLMSEKARRSRELFLMIHRPVEILPLMYRRILFII